MTCIDCASVVFNNQVVRASWRMSSANTNEQAMKVDDPPSQYADRIVVAFHDGGHKDLDAAIEKIRLEGKQ